MLIVAFLALLMVPQPWTVGLLIAATAWSAARWSATARGERAGRRDAEAPVRTLLGIDERGRPVAVEDRELGAHGLILGASGSGKSTTLLTILAQHVAHGRSVVAIDLKGSPAFAGRLRAAADAAGRRFVLWTLDGTSHWNPLAHGNATELKDKLIATERFTEPHYQRAAERYVQNGQRFAPGGASARPLVQPARPRRPGSQCGGAGRGRRRLEGMNSGRAPR
jgi:hypothetical protein